MKKFDDSFLFGTATAAHQVEGNNINSDFWAMEQIPHSMFKEPSLGAVDHYNQYENDLKLLKDAGYNAYRFSIEWARIEPIKGKFSRKEIEHYKAVLEFCHKNSITPIVTLYHFSSPKWLISEGGWENEKTIEYFVNYCSYVTSELGDLMPYVCTINEANIGLQISKTMKRFLEADKNQSETKKKQGDVQVGLNVDTASAMEEYQLALGEIFGIDPKEVNTFLAPRSEKGDKIIIRCHEEAGKAIKKINSNIKVGITFSLHDNQALPGGEEFVNTEQADEFLHYLPYLKEDDFIGVQNYSRKIYGPNGVICPNEDTRVTKAGYEFYPKALEGVIRFVASYWNKPLLVTENGISTDNDEERIEFIDQAINGVRNCIEDGIPVIGYMHWSLLDNFEWQLGYSQTFGLIAVDRTTQTRYPKESFYYLSKLIKS